MVDPLIEPTSLTSHRLARALAFSGLTAAIAVTAACAQPTQYAASSGDCIPGTISPCSCGTSSFSTDPNVTTGTVMMGSEHGITHCSAAGVIGVCDCTAGKPETEAGAPSVLCVVRDAVGDGGTAYTCTQAGVSIQWTGGICSDTAPGSGVCPSGSQCSVNAAAKDAGLQTGTCE